MESQAIPLSYADKTTLSQFLRQLFGQSYSVDTRQEHWMLTIPRRLTDDEIKGLQKSSHPK
ncbi:hypothetical protein P154DRAFT_528199 [Amniculicola lignicola CBS 123094]|uniref:Uncharacterized protein n=1 Tax=Amniculicola lignicola CBS 123094 TaxID=1392246 RepID=A0A6A5VVY1_9PLEO|nr:hypothetical protein P154DRAFT_528199 [Amniculicola lignicola CBS 123094]